MFLQRRIIVTTQLQKNTSQQYHWIYAVIAMLLAMVLVTSSAFPGFLAFGEAKHVGSVQAHYQKGNTGSANKANSNRTYMNYDSSKLPNKYYQNVHGSHWYPKDYKSANFTGQNGSTGAFYCIMPSMDIPPSYTTYQVYQLTDSTGKVLYSGTPKYVFSDQNAGAHLKINKQIQLLRILMMYTDPNVPNQNSYKYAAGQALTWEILVGERKEDFSHVEPTGGHKTAANYGGDHSSNSTYGKAYKDLVKKVQDHIQKYGLSDEDKTKTSQFPSFASGTKTLQQTGNGSNKQYTLTLTDTNNVLSNYKVTSSDKNLKLSQNGNQLTITTSTPPDEGKTSSITLTSTNSDTNSGILYLLHRQNNQGKPSAQDGVLTVKSPMKTSFKVKAPTTEKLDPLTLEIEKKSSDGTTANMSGAVFTLQWYKNGQVTGTPTGTYTVSPEQDESTGKYVAHLENAEHQSGEEMPLDENNNPGFPSGSLIVVSETTAPANFNKDPTWTVDSGTNATVVGNTVQIKIQDDSSNSASATNTVKLTATDTIVPHFDFSTSLVDSKGSNRVNANTTAQVELTDIVTIDEDSTGLDGASGTIVGQLYDASDGSKVGSAQTLEIKDVKAGAKYSQKFTADVSKYANTGKGTTLYADETITLTKDGKPLEGSPKTEQGKDSIAQQVEVTSEEEDEEYEMSTTLSSSNGMTGTLNRSNSTVLSDAIKVSGISDKLKGTSATLTSTLMGPDGKQIGNNKKTQTVKLDNTTYTQTFDAFDSTDESKYPSETGIVYANEVLTFKDTNGQTRTISENGSESESQQVKFTTPDHPIPQIGTKLTDKTKQNNTVTIPSDGKLTLIDTVSYEQLTAGQSYTLEGTLMDKTTGEALKDASGNPVTATANFTASSASGTQDVTFNFTTTTGFSNPIVAYETLKDSSGKEIAVHKDINDVTQTVTPKHDEKTPHISTSVRNKETDDHSANATKEVTLIDTVKYDGLEENTKYTMQGTLMHRSTGTEILHNNKAVTNQVEFTSSSTGSGTVEVPFTFNAKDIQLKGQSLNLAGQDIVVFEKLFKPGDTTVIARHEDRNDTEQIIHFPKGHTNARDAETLTQNSNAGKKVTIKDVVTYENLIPGHTYSITGTAYRQDTGKPLTDNGKVVSNTISFTPTSANGSVVVPVTFDASLLAGKTIVMFEDCKYNGYSVFVHADIHDKQQSIYVPELHTVAVNKKDGSNQLGVGNCKISDKVSYKNLIVGQEYTIEGVLMDKSTGKPITIDGKQVTGSATFTAEQETGYQVVDFKVDTSKISAKHIVVFETLYTGNHKVVGSHKDINDTDQTVTVVPTIPTGSFPIVPVAIAAGAVVLGAGLYFIFRKKKHPKTASNK